jgi:hypothetical protein
MTERAGQLPSILGDGNDLMNQPHVMGIIVNKRNQGLIAGFTGNCIAYSLLVANLTSHFKRST